ncbi:hypothetical protein HN446_02820 [bacterium]|jgi:hypothetical protein|nr:hypothetical protein [bacterium]
MKKQIIAAIFLSSLFALNIGAMPMGARRPGPTAVEAARLKRNAETKEARRARDTKLRRQTMPARVAPKARGGRRIDQRRGAW